MSKTDTRRAISEIVLNPSFRQWVLQDVENALSRYQLKEAEVEFLKYLAAEGLPDDLEQHLPPYRRRSYPGTLRGGPPGRPLD